MSVLFDNSPGTIFACAAGLIVYFGLVLAIPILPTLQAWQGKCLPYFEFNFHKGGGYTPTVKQINAMVTLQGPAHFGNIFSTLA